MPEWIWDFTKSFIGAGFGTAAMTAAISIWRDRGQRRSEATYLALRLAVILERYTFDCNDLIVTNKNAWTPPGEEFPNWTVSLPELEAYPTSNEGWRALDPGLASDCLNFPNRIREGQSAIGETLEYHPEGADEAVQNQASECGLEAWSLAERLRARYKIKPIDPAFDYVGQLQRAKQAVDASRAASAAEQRRIFESIK